MSDPDPNSNPDPLCQMMLADYPSLSEIESLLLEERSLFNNINEGIDNLRAAIDLLQTEAMEDANDESAADGDTARIGGLDLGIDRAVSYY